ncbi:MAG: thioredoxin [Anaerolineales bacterium]|nr:thioredoxin [Anaerolineales bacterium]
MSEVKYITEQEFQEEVVNSQIPVLVDFTAGWCQPCKMLAPIVEDLAEQWKGKVKVLKVDVDQNQGAAMQYSVMSIPTLIFFKGGEVKERMTGYAPKDKIEGKFAPHF